MTATLTGQVVKAVLKNASKQTEATELRAAARQLMEADSLPPVIAKGLASPPTNPARPDDGNHPPLGQPGPDLRDFAGNQDPVKAPVTIPLAPSDTSSTRVMSADHPVVVGAPQPNTTGTPVQNLRNFAGSNGTITGSLRATPVETAAAPPSVAVVPPRAVDVLEDVLQRVQDIRRILSTQASAPTTPEEADQFCRLVDQIVQRLRLAADGAPPCHAADHPDRRNRS